MAFQGKKGLKGLSDPQMDFNTPLGDDLQEREREKMEPPKTKETYAPGAYRKRKRNFHKIISQYLSIPITFRVEKRREKMFGEIKKKIHTTTSYSKYHENGPKPTCIHNNKREEVELNFCPFSFVVRNIHFRAL